MLRGKKVMHLFNNPEFDYLPGETVILPQQVEMVIDFPEAELENPTQCLALEIDRSKIQQLIDILNERYPKEDAEPWKLNFEKYYLMNNEAVASTLNKIVQICMSELREHLHEKINLQALCNLACMSSSTFYRYIKKATGLSPQELILRERLKYAKQLLSTSNLLITEVAFDAGFDDANYFTRAFKKNEGLTPKRYQQKLIQSSL